MRAFFPVRLGQSFRIAHLETIKLVIQSLIFCVIDSWNKYVTVTMSTVSTMSTIWGVMLWLVPYFEVNWHLLILGFVSKKIFLISSIKDILDKLAPCDLTPAVKKRGVSLLDQTRHKHFHFYPQVELPKRMTPPVHWSNTNLCQSGKKNGGNA